MKIIKLGIISIIVFGLLFLIFSLLIPSTIRISRATDIHAAPATIRAKMKTENGWNLLEDVNDKRVVQNFRFEESAGITVVQWYFDFRLRWYPWEKFAGITFDKRFGPAMEQSLNNLKKLVENSP